MQERESVNALCMGARRLGGDTYLVYKALIGNPNPFLAIALILGSEQQYCASDHRLRDVPGVQRFGHGYQRAWSIAYHSKTGEAISIVFKLEAKRARRCQEAVVQPDYLINSR